MGKTYNETNYTPQNDLQALVFKSLSDDKGADIIAIDLNADLALADTMFIVSGTSGRHIAAMAEKLKERLKIKGHDDIRIEGLTDPNWVVLDAGDIIVTARMLFSQCPDAIHDVITDLDTNLHAYHECLRKHGG